MLDYITSKVAKSFPFINHKLKQAGIKDTLKQFVKKTLISASYMTIGLLFCLFSFLPKEKKSILILIIAFPIVFFMMFSYFLRYPDVKIIKKRKEIEREIVYAGRFLIIELSSGVLLYEAMSNVSKSYKEIGKTFNNILHSINLGTSIENALNEAIEYTPSPDFRRVMWQIVNALKTGANISESLQSVINQITREQTIQIKTYAKKLNPLAMFYMIIAVILPSLGITMLIVLSSFISLELSLSFLISVAIMLGLLQFMFFTIIKSSRPAVGI
jgi:archaeal flagellar protein FlaJ